MIRIGCIANSLVLKRLAKDLEDRKIEFFDLRDMELAVDEVDVVVYNNNSRTGINSEKVNSLLENAKLLLLNTDESLNSELFIGKEINVITYGLNDKATITISSATEDAILLDIQREIEDIRGEIIEVGELKVGNIKRRKIQEVLLCKSIEILC